MDVKIVQIDIGEGEAFGGNILKNLGITMEGQAGSDTGPHFLLSTQATASLNILVNHGKAKILSEPHLTCRSGEHATFHSGGEIGFRVSGVGHADVKFKEYGLILQIEPHITEQENIESHISLEISSPTSAPASSQDVGFTKFNAESHLIGKPNETIIIAGLAENIERRFQEQTPLLGDIPVLSLFFKQEQNQRSRKELLMIVTPTLSKVEKNADYRSHSIRQRDEIENLLTDENDAP
jgi:Flp pilus assembly secretin CpaC